MHARVTLVDEIGEKRMCHAKIMKSRTIPLLIERMQALCYELFLFISTRCVKKEIPIIFTATIVTIEFFEVYAKNKSRIRSALVVSLKLAPLAD